MDFADPLDHKMKRKESKRIEEYMDLDKGIFKENCQTWGYRWTQSIDHQMIRKRSGIIGNQ